MMNGLALFLVISSLAAGGKWSPYPDQKDPEEVIVKEGTRVVVVEYDKEGPGNTKVSISPQEADHVIFQKVIEGKDKFKEKVMEASEVLPNMDIGLSRGQHHHPQSGQNPKDLLSDAFDKCKEKIAAKICRSEEKVSEKAHESQECAKETYSKAKEKVSEKAHEIQEEAKNAYTNTKEKVPEKTHKFQEGVKDAVKKAKDAAKSNYDVGKTIVEDIAGNASKIESGLRNQMMKTVKGEEDESKDGGDTVKSTLREFQEQLHHDLVKRGYDTVLSASATRPLMCVIHILGFATAYGVCVWVTFFSSFVLAGALPNQQFAVVQSKIYPFYFKTMALCVGLALLGHAMSQGEKVVYRRFHICQGYALLATVVMVLINLLYLEPRATKVMFERMRVENEERKVQRVSRVEGDQPPDTAATTTTIPGTEDASDPRVMGRLDQERKNDRILELNQRLKKLNTYSSFLNILTLMLLKIHLIYLAQRLHLSS